VIAPRTAFAILAGVALLAALGWALLPNLAPAVVPPVVDHGFGDVLWSDRALDLIVQAFLLLTGVLAILLVLRDPSREEHDG